MIDPLVLKAIGEEAEDAANKHGAFPEDANHQLRILVQEVGEVAQAIADVANRRVGWYRVESEALQVASVAAQMCESAGRKRLGAEKKEVKKVAAVPVEPEWAVGARRPKSYDTDNPAPRSAIATVDDWVKEHRDHGITFYAMTGKRKCECGEEWPRPGKKGTA